MNMYKKWINSPLVPLSIPVVSMGILTMGNSLFTTISTLQLEKLQMPLLFIGIISAAYFAGMMIGAYRAQSFIFRIGYIRSYAALASIVAISSLVLGITSNGWIWLILRFCCGFGLSGLFIVIESWCLESSDSKIKGFIFAFYMFTYYSAQGLGQLLLKIDVGENTFLLFVLMTVLAMFSIIPVCLTRFTLPKIEASSIISPVKFFKQVPLGIFGSICAGAMLGGVYSLLPLVLNSFKYDKDRIATIMFLTFIGGTLFQLPIGRISDKMDRRRMILYVSIIVLIISFLNIIYASSYQILLPLSFILGGVVFVIYPLSISHATDLVGRDATLSVLSAMSLSYGIGATIGPIVISNFMKIIGPKFLYIFFIFISSLLIFYSFKRINFVTPIIKEDKKSTFVPTAPEVLLGSKGDKLLDQKLNN